jgi:hypothetical protein
MTTPPLVLVEWNDHCESDGNVWMTADEAAECRPATCQSVGWLLHHDTERVVLTTSRVIDEDTVARPFVIVTAAVRRIVPLAHTERML